MSGVPLALLLLRASRWFDRQLLDRLSGQGYPRLSPAQSLVFAYLDPAGTTPAELARRLGNTRQATQQLLAGLVSLKLLTLQPNPARRGGLLVTLTDHGTAMACDAARILHSLETDLGVTQSAELRNLLTAFEHVDPTTTRHLQLATPPPAQHAQQ